MDNQSKALLGVVGVLLLLLLGVWGWSLVVPRGSHTLPTISPAVSSPNFRVKRAPQVLVQVSGAVASPGVYEVTANLRVGQVLAELAGVLPTADLDRVNLVQRVKDGKRISVPYQQSKRVNRSLGGSSLQPGFPIPINRATASQLQAVPGIGPVMADRIVRSRQEAGPFKDLSELQRVKGIGAKTTERLKSYLKF